MLLCYAPMGHHKLPLATRITHQLTNTLNYEYAYTDKQQIISCRHTLLLHAMVVLGLTTEGFTLLLHKTVK